MRPRIVIADDHMFVLEGLQALFRASEFELVGSAVDGRQAVELAVEHRPDIVLLDVCMPVESGIEALARLRSTLPELPVVMFSFYDDHSQRQQCQALGAADFLQKGMPGSHVLERIRAVLGSSAGAGVTSS